MRTFFEVADWTIHQIVDRVGAPSPFFWHSIRRAAKYFSYFLGLLTAASIIFHYPEWLTLILTGATGFMNGSFVTTFLAKLDGKDETPKNTTL